MSDDAQKKPQRLLGYPPLTKVQHGCQLAAITHPDVVHRTVSVKLHNIKEREAALLLAIFRNNTLAAAWILRDIERRRPLKRFAKYRQRDRPSYYTRGIADEIRKSYREAIRKRFTVNSYIFNGLCSTIAEMLSSWLVQMTTAQESGDLDRYRASARYLVDVGKHVGQTLEQLGRKVAFGYVFLHPTREQYEELQQHLLVLLDQNEEDEERSKQAEAYVMPFHPHRGQALGTMRRSTWQRLLAIANRNLEQADSYERLRKAAQDFLRFSPSGFPHVDTDGLTIERRRELDAQRREALKNFAALPIIDESQLGRKLTDNERELFVELQKRAYAAVRQPNYLPLAWERADGWTRDREMGLAFDPISRAYYLLLYILESKSPEKQVLSVPSSIYDVNAPDVILTSGQKPSMAMLFEIECGREQCAILDQARRDAFRWKEVKGTEGGCIRSADLHARYLKEEQHWWFEGQIQVGTIPDSPIAPEHVVGVHINPEEGCFVSVLTLEGTCCDLFFLSEERIAVILQNKDPHQQSLVPSEKRTKNERYHRIADALVAVCVQYRAQLGVESIAYRYTGAGPRSDRPKNLVVSSGELIELVNYKLPLAGLPKTVELKGISPRRDCGRCGVQQVERTNSSAFVCASCGHHELRYLNTAREAGRRTLWMLANKTERKKKERRREPIQ